MNISDAVIGRAEAVYREALIEMTLTEGSGGFKRASQHRRAIRAAVDAIGPIIAAQALRGAAKNIDDWIKAGADEPVGPDETAKWLRARADQTEAHP